MNVPAICIALAALFALMAQAVAGELPPGTSLVTERGLDHESLTGAETDRVIEQITVTGKPFNRALRVRTKVVPESSWAVQLTVRTDDPVKKGDVILARFWARSAASADETGEAVAEFIFEQAGDPWTKSKQYLARVGTEWTQIHVPIESADDYDAGEAQACLRLGFGPQSIEIASFELINFGRKVKLEQLPHTVPTYRGQEAGAKWRKEALARIEKIRKAGFTVTVTGPDGRPVKGAAVKVSMKRHAYGFGSCVNSSYLQDGNETADKKRYRDEIARLFNRVVLENNLKWPQWESRRADAEKTVAWLRGQGKEIRGHCLVWPSWRRAPDDVAALKDKPDELRARTLAHVRDEASALRGKLVDWDVINEPFSEHDITDVLGRECMVNWFKVARAADPDVNLYINDYSILSGGGGDSAHRRHYEETIKYLIAEGAPLDGIGVQCHFGNAVTAPEEMLKLLDRYAAFGKPIQVTEFDMKTGSDEFEGRYTRDFLITLFSHPSTTGILMWGFWDGRHWKQNAPIFRRDWSVKPSGKAWMDLVLKQWWTDLDDAAGANGVFSGRGFLGDYEVTVTSGGKTATAKMSIAKGGAKVAITLK